MKTTSVLALCLLAVSFLAACAPPPNAPPATAAPADKPTAAPADKPTAGDWPAILDLAKSNLTAANYVSHGPVAYFAKQSECNVDIFDALKGHGKALLEGIGASADSATASREYAEALKEIARFSGALYCMDIAELLYWDRLMGMYLDLAAATSSPCDAVVAAWNPALNLVDAVQYTGSSEIVASFGRHGKDFSTCLQGYPIDNYGAAWLADFGTTRLVQVRGATARDNLITALVKPSVLGLGLCSLVAHADKTDKDLACPVGQNAPALCGGELAQVIQDGSFGPMTFEETAFEGGWAITIGPSMPTQFFGSSTADLIASIGLCKGKSDAGMNSGCRSFGELAQTMCRMGGVVDQGLFEQLEREQCMCREQAGQIQESLRGPTTIYHPPVDPMCGVSQESADSNENPDGKITKNLDGKLTDDEEDKLEEMAKEARRKTDKQRTEANAEENRVARLRGDKETKAVLVPTGATRAAARATANAAPVIWLKQSDWDAKATEKYVHTAGAILGGGKGKREIYPDPQLREMPAIAGEISGLIRHERTHIYVEERGVPPEEPYRHKTDLPTDPPDTVHEVVFRNHKIPGYHKRPGSMPDPESGDSGCYDDPAILDRMARMMDCVTPAQDQRVLLDVLGPVSMPNPEDPKPISPSSLSRLEACGGIRSLLDNGTTICPNRAFTDCYDQPFNEMTCKCGASKESIGLPGTQKLCQVINCPAGSGVNLFDCTCFEFSDPTLLHANDLASFLMRPRGPGGIDPDGPIKHIELNFAPPEAKLTLHFEKIPGSDLQIVGNLKLVDGKLEFEPEGTTLILADIWRPIVADLNGSLAGLSYGPITEMTVQSDGIQVRLEPPGVRP
jgi:hypothetical protein